MQYMNNNTQDPLWDSVYLKKPIEYVLHYLPSAIRSRSKDFICRLDRSSLQELCMSYVITTFTKLLNHTCFACEEKLIQKFNESSAMFGIRAVCRTTFQAILKRCYNLNLITNEPFLEHGRSFRRLSINKDVFKRLFPSAFNLAYHNATNKVNCINDVLIHRNKNVDNSVTNEEKTGIFKKFNEKLGLGRSVLEKGIFSIKNIELCQNGISKIELLRSKNYSKEYKKKSLKGSTRHKFNYVCFGNDAQLAETLQQKAREGRISNKEICDLGCLYALHGVRLDPTWHKYLRHISQKNAIYCEREADLAEIFAKAFPV